MGEVLKFPASRLPNTVEVEFDLGSWTIKYSRNNRFISRLRFENKAEAEKEAIRLCEDGFTWRFGDNGQVYVFPHEADGGCWAIAQSSRSGDSDGILGRHFSLEMATISAICTAREIGAELSLAVTP